MTAKGDIHRVVGETLELAQALEEAITLPILMIFIIESGWQKDLGPDEISHLMDEARGNARISMSKPINEKFRQNMRVQIGQIKLLVQNGSMGELKRSLESRLHVSPGGPSASIEVLQNALDARNYLCHDFFKKHMANKGQNAAIQAATSELKEMKETIHKAIAFATTLTHSLREQFPNTFVIIDRRLH